MAEWISSRTKGGIVINREPSVYTDVEFGYEIIMQGIVNINTNTFNVDTKSEVIEYCLHLN